ncbi:hypothetical protein BaRGS_00024201 [Batillaria attramentaria]|uniref:Uncharacterized protein n=1 Tax=Batillaria attramentaria TaxID=370345 RepID=A0ABD0KBR4_9CAEN
MFLSSASGPPASPQGILYTGWKCELAVYYFFLSLVVEGGSKKISFITAMSSALDPRSIGFAFPRPPPLHCNLFSNRIYPRRNHARPLPGPDELFPLESDCGPWQQME